jgi:hypothetical protein
MCGKEVERLEDDPDLAAERVRVDAAVRDDPAVDGDRALVDALEQVHAAEQRRLPRAGRAEVCDEDQRRAAEEIRVHDRQAAERCRPATRQAAHDRNREREDEHERLRQEHHLQVHRARLGLLLRRDDGRVEHERLAAVDLHRRERRGRRLVDERLLRGVQHTPATPTTRSTSRPAWSSASAASGPSSTMSSAGSTRSRVARAPRPLLRSGRVERERVDVRGAMVEADPLVEPVRGLAVRTGREADRPGAALLREP